MSKKRQSRKSRTRQTSSQTADKGRFNQKDFNPDYSQTIKDLKRIGILASSFFMILIALTFFLR